VEPGERERQETGDAARTHLISRARSISLTRLSSRTGLISRARSISLSSSTPLHRPDPLALADLLISLIC
jgi:hypothetical protein